MKKVGIITHYYHSLNYGGVLQAYALCRLLKDHGYDCEQICYDSSANGLKKNTVKKMIGRLVAVLFFERKWRKRRLAFSEFRERIPHSETVYTKDSIVQCVDHYDVFITGSDQVWNLKAYHPAYFLDFVSSDRCKLSYAASLCTDHLEESEKALFQKSLRDFTAISVREKDSVDVLSPLVTKSVNWVVDPVFLLTPSHWDELCSKRIVQSEYLFCYFLGSDRVERNLARQYAQKKHLKIVTIPYIHQYISKDMCADFGFGDIRLHDVSPEQFISLIKYAKVVFTDSFHAVAFSTIYKKDFFVFERANEKKMSSRIRTIVEILGAQDHFCTGEHQVLDYLINCTPINYGMKQEYMESLNSDSLNFLIDNIG